MTSEHQPRQESVSPKSQLRDLADLSTTTADDSFTAEADGSSIGDHEVTKNQETSISETAPSENPSIAIQTPLPRSPISPHLTSEARIAALVSPVVGGEMDQVSRPSSRSPASADVEALQQRLKLVEQRFADVSTSFKRLQAEKRAVDGILRELTPIEGMQDQVALRDYLQNMNQKLEISQDEIMRLNGKLTRQEERLEELRDTHRLESASFTEEADNLRQQLEAAKNALQAAESVKAKSDEEAAKHRAEIERLKNENEKASTMAKDEEEKRVKAIALLKTVRQKLVKTEKDRDDAIKDANATKGKDKEELARLHHEIEKVNAEREQAITGMRAHFDRELAGLKERQAKDIAALRGQFELEAISTKAAHAKELAARDSKIAVLENSVRNLTNEKNKYFDLLQVRQGEYESAESHSQSLEAQTTELQYQLREANERICLLTEELLEARREQDHGRRKPSVSAEEVTLNLQATEARYENMLREVRKQIEALEAERADAEAMWARRLEEKAKEVENLRELVDTNRESSGIKEQSMKESQQQVDRLKEELRLVRLDVQKMQREVDAAREAQTGAQEESKELGSKLAALEKLIEEVKLRETQLKAANKALRGELHKVQTSAALLERQRNPGVGYWSASRQDLPDNVEMDSRISVSSTSDVSRNSTPRIGSPTPTSGSEEEINLEYLRNVILQFLEHKEMRPNLVRVLAAILRFTPQETRRLVAKV
ncbi:hypothetical protein PUNSTDRAFT_79643 [Punctularia strigosozonata HHB-11173 SS5]|uniref:uncharacterized protein n=1 Tax=Punctularia strigosozonata (strain HHB-11173) TaxID=741275 RepID=UPI00044175DD|nr:uncharacterized protein PUNSTDRAFT_79643 [Punctularia strigosozonata HHB-11173 SS5]EIN13811.1 hypothetical protein PUNSTDRAFT_79643 [Punctularia strigosozonata HHB-11173 SS5]